MGKKILVIDDSEVYLETTFHFLTDKGYDDILSISSGEEGFERAKKEDVDLIILDVSLGDANGYDICAKIRGVKGNKVKIIIITGEADMVDTTKAKKVGADDFLVKTSDRDLLLNAIKNQIG